MDEVDVLVDLLEVPSPSGAEDAACVRFAARARELGLRAGRDAVGNVIATTGDGRPRVVFLGHIDTSPGNWPVTVQDGTVHARGSVDAKGPLVAALAAAARLGASTRGTMTVVGAVGEETDSRGALHLLRSPPPDALLVGEPSRWDRVTIGYRGRRTGSFRAASVPKHPSAPTPGPVDLAVAVAARIQAFIASQGRPSWFSSPSCRIVRWDHASSTKEEAVEFTVDVRAPSGFEWEVLERIAPEVRWSPPIDGALVGKDNAAVRALVAGIRSRNGTPAFLLKGGTSDMNLAARAWRIPMASYGPGDPTLAHGPEERLSLDEFRRSIDVLEDAFRRLSRALPTESA